MQPDCSSQPASLETDLIAQVADLTRQLAVEKAERQRLEGTVHHLTQLLSPTQVRSLQPVEQMGPLSYPPAVVGIDLLEREQLIAAIAQRIRQSLKLEEILQTTADEVRQFLQTDRVVLYQFQANWQGVITVESVGEPWRPILGEAVSDSCLDENYGQQYQQGRTRAIADIRKANLELCHVEFLAALQVQANLVVPILQGDHLWGLLIAHHCASPRQWHPWEVNFLERLAIPVGLAIKQADLHHQLEVELQERRQAEVALRASEQRFRTLVQNIPGAVYRYRRQRDWVLEFISAAIELITGYSSRDFLEQGRSLTSLIHPDDRSRIRSALEVSLKARQPYELEYRIQDVRGVIRWVMDRGQGVFSATGELLWLDGVLHDISDRKATEAALRESEERFRAVFENAPIGMGIIRVNDYQQVRVNSELAEMLGYSEAEFQQLTMLDISHPEDLKNDLDHLQRLLSGELKSFQIEKRYIKKNRDILQTALTCSVIRDQDQAPLYYLGMVEDITARKQAEADMLQALTREKELSDLRSRFVSMTSHEFRTPLTIISSSAQLLEHYDWSKAEQVEQLQQIQSAVRHMVQLLEGVLTLGQAEAGKLQFQPRSLDLTPLCQTILSDIQCSGQGQHLLRFQSQGVSGVETAQPDPSCPALVDETLMRQILMNLLANAIKYSPSGGTIQLSLVRLDQAVILEVEDEGTGIPEQDQPLLFDSFYRGTNVGNIPGTGLGLAIVKKCVEMHRGAIAVQSQVGVGTKFTITLPQLPIAHLCETES